jgi:hypothetical protein
MSWRPTALLGALLLVLSIAISPTIAAAQNVDRANQSAVKNGAEIIVKFKPTATRGDKERVREKVGATLEKTIETEPWDPGHSNLELLAVPRPKNWKATSGSYVQTAINVIKSDPSVQYAEFNSTVSAAK